MSLISSFENLSRFSPNAGLKIKSETLIVLNAFVAYCRRSQVILLFPKYKSNLNSIYIKCTVDVLTAIKHNSHAEQDILMVDIDYFPKRTVTANCLVTNILQSVFFWVQQKKETHTGLQRTWARVIFILWWFNVIIGLKLNYFAQKTSPRHLKQKKPPPLCYSLCHMILPKTGFNLFIHFFCSSAQVLDFFFELHHSVLTAFRVKYWHIYP